MVCENIFMAPPRPNSFSHKLVYVTIFWEILNSKGHQNHIIDSKVTDIWLNGWILPVVCVGGVCGVGGVVELHREVYACSLQSRVVLVS